MKTVMFAGRPFPIDQIRATIKLLDYYRRFLQSDCERARHPEARFGGDITKAEARRRLGFLVNVAINRKAGIPDVACRKQTPEYQASLARDCRFVRERVNRRLRIYSLETRDVRERYRHLIVDIDQE